MCNVLWYVSVCTLCKQVIAHTPIGTQVLIYLTVFLMTGPGQEDSESESLCYLKHREAHDFSVYS